MSSIDSRCLARLPVALSIAAACVVLLALAAPSARAAEVVSGSATWGVKESFRSYVSGPIAHGTITTSAGATENSDGTFDFPAADGSFDVGARNAVIDFTGSVRFLGHGGQLDMTITGLRVHVEGDAGTLYADVVSRDLASGEYQQYPDTSFADLDLTGIDPTPSGAGASWSAIPATLIADGAAAFAGFYAAGTPLDSLSFTVSEEPVSPPVDPPPSDPPVSAPLPQPPASQPPPPEVVGDARIERLKKRHTVRRPKGFAIARVSCRAESCAVLAPRAVRLRVGKREHEVKISASDQLGRGERAKVRARLSRKLVNRLEGRKARLKVPLRVTYPADATKLASVSMRVKTTLEGKGHGKRGRRG